MAKSTFYISGRELIIVFGDIVKIQGQYVKPQGQRNYKGFDYSLYLKSKKIFGSIRADNAEKVGVNCTLMMVDMHFPVLEYSARKAGNIRKRILIFMAKSMNV